MIKPQELLVFDLSLENAKYLADRINNCMLELSGERAWQKITKEFLVTYSFDIHLFIFKKVFPSWPNQLDSAPAWLPESDLIDNANMSLLMSELGQNNLKAFHAWTVENYSPFWQIILKKLNIIFRKQPSKIIDLSKDIEKPQWLVDAKLNIAESCFTANPNKNAAIFLDSKNQPRTISYGELNALSNRVANSLKKRGIKIGDAIAIAMPMNIEAVAIYLGIIKLGAVVVPIADSFSAEEIATRLTISPVKLIFTQDIILRNSKKLPLFEKIVAANTPPAIVLATDENLDALLRKEDIDWHDFLTIETDFVAIACDPMAHCTILFSSGTTGVSKAIPWNHTTAIKAASDGYLHHNIQENDVIAWPTNLGWMMGPWLIFATLINHGTLALYTDVPMQRAFGEFIHNAKVTLLGIVPSIVASWRNTHCMEGLDWQAIKTFSSTGECSNAEDMLYLMYLAGYKPIIEYCGGTEIGGGYITSTVIEKNYPSVFTTPAMGSNFVILDDNGKQATVGEVALIPPALGLSTELLNADHHAIYYANMPRSSAGKILRRHGDQIKQLPSGYYCLLGRADDTMNLGGIKVSSAEIERVITGIEGIAEVAAIAIANQGPSLLVIYAVTVKDLSAEEIKQQMQARINERLNPLFKIHKVIFTDSLPKTASNKIMRGVLRKQYE